MTHAEATHWAGLTLSPYARCAICGLPKRILDAYLRQRYPYLGVSDHTLQVDHLDPRGPSVRENLRVLCGKCNKARGAAIFSDEDVLKRVRRWWLFRMSAADLWWLHTTPGTGGRAVKGGRLHDQEEISRCAALEEHAGDEQLPPGAPPADGDSHRAV